MHAEDEGTDERGQDGRDRDEGRLLRRWLLLLLIGERTMRDE
jgi:hypothetical protein